VGVGSVLDNDHHVTAVGTRVDHVVTFLIVKTSFNSELLIARLSGVTSYYGTLGHVPQGPLDVASLICLTICVNNIQGCLALLDGWATGGSIFPYC